MVENQRTKMFLDANILLEVLFARSKLEDVQKALSDDRYEFYICSLTVHLLYYFAELENISSDFVRQVVGLARHLPLDEEVIAEAQKRYKGRDFEDCLQASCAEIYGCEEILTIDKSFERDSITSLKVVLLQ